MDMLNRGRFPATAIALDLAGCVLVVVGALQLNGVDIPFLSATTDGQRSGWTLIVFGLVFVTAATMLILGVVLARRGTRETHPTANRHSR